MRVLEVVLAELLGRGRGRGFRHERQLTRYYATGTSRAAGERSRRGRSGAPQGPRGRAPATRLTCRGRPEPIPSQARGDPRGAGRVPVPRRARPGRLRGEGEVAAAAAQPVLRRLHRAAPAHPADAHHGGERRVDGGQHRGRGAAAGVLLDQGVRPAVQRQVPRRQVLPLPRGDHGRGVPPGHGDARRQAEGHAVLRPLLARVGDQGDGRHAAARLPGPHLLHRRVQARRPDRPPLPARLHRQVLRAVRQADQRATTTGRSPRTSATSCPARRAGSSGSSPRR